MELNLENFILFLLYFYVFFMGFIVGMSYARNERIDKKYSSTCPSDIPKGIAPPKVDKNKERL